MKHLIIAVLLTGCASIDHHPLTDAMQVAYHEEYGFKGLCQRRTDNVLKQVTGSYPVYMQLTKEVAGYKNPYHVLPCLDGLCVDSTGIISDKYTLIPESELVYFAYDIK